MSYFGSLFRAGTVTEQLPLIGASYTRRLGGSGQGDLSGQLLLADMAGLTTRVQALLDATVPWLCSVWADDDQGQLRWGGPIVSRQYDSGTGVLSIKGAEVGAYFARRTVQTGRTFTGVDQLAIQRTLYSDAMAQVGGDVGVVLGSDTSGVVRDRTYVAGQRKQVEEAAREVSDVIDGFDYAWSPVYSGGLPRLLLQQGYPTLGSGQSVELAYPGEVTAYSFPEDGGAMATMAWAIGKQDQATNTTPMAAATATTLLDAGYPLLELTNSYTEVADQATLQAHADADVVAQAGPLVKMRLDMTLAGLYASGLDLGNPVTVTIEDPARWPAPVRLGLRCVAVTERPAEGTASVEVADRVLTGGRVPSERTAAELLASLSRRVLNIETV